MMNLSNYTNHPNRYPYIATNKQTGEKVAYGFDVKAGQKIYKVIAPSAGSIALYDQQDFDHYFEKSNG